MSKLNSFRDLLVKKTHDVSLQNLIKFIKTELFEDLVSESLEKMARSSHKGDAANAAVRDFGTEMDPAHEPSMIHDALSHHVSQYKAALASGNHAVANQHAKQTFRIMDLADSAQKHSGGKLQVDAVHPAPWERNHRPETFGEKINKLQEAKASGQALAPKDEEWLGDNPVTRGAKKPSQHIIDTKAWRFRGNDYGFLQQAPHASYSQEVRRHGNTNAYPFEKIKINGKHLDINDGAQSGTFKAHAFDSNPVMDHFEEPAGKRTPEREKQYRDERDKHADSPELAQYFSARKQQKESNPEAFAARGSQKSSPVHKQIDPLDLSAPASAPSASAPSASAPSASAPSASGQQVVTRKPTAKLSPKDRAAIMASLPPDLQETFKRNYPDEE